jgi:IstB-like ATP binding protein
MQLSPTKLSDQGHQALLEAYLKTLNLPMFLEHYQAYAKDAMRSGQSPERFGLSLCEAENSHRDAQRIEHSIKMAKLPFIKEISTFDFSAIESMETNACPGTGARRIHHISRKPFAPGHPGPGENPFSHCFGSSCLSARKARPILSNRKARR